MLQWDQPQHVFHTYALIQHTCSMKHITYTMLSLRAFGCLVHLLIVCHRHKRALCESTYHSTCIKRAALASSQLTPVPNGCSSASFTFVATYTCTYMHMVKNFAGTNCFSVMIAAPLPCRARRSCPFALVPSHPSAQILDFSRFQPQ